MYFGRMLFLGILTCIVIILLQSLSMRSCSLNVRMKVRIIVIVILLFLTMVVYSFGIQHHKLSVTTEAPSKAELEILNILWFPVGLLVVCGLFRCRLNYMRTEWGVIFGFSYTVIVYGMSEVISPFIFATQVKVLGRYWEGVIHIITPLAGWLIMMLISWFGYFRHRKLNREYKPRGEPGCCWKTFWTLFTFGVETCFNPSFVSGMGSPPDEPDEMLETHL